MTRYADPQQCPDCRQHIEYGVASCPTCHLPLLGPMALRLFQTLTEADRLVESLRSVRTSAASAAGAPGAAGAAGAAGANMPPVGVPVSAPAVGSMPHPTAPGQSAGRSPDQSRGRGLSAASVPKILLGLGAACVLLAALVFLAVTWSVMGVAGRTATLVGFTVMAGGLTALMARRGLRGAAEALSLVALGLLTLDVFGAQDSGWFGAISTAGFLVLLGALVAVVAAGAGVAVRRTKAAKLTGSEIVAALGLGLVAVGVASTDRFADSAALVLAVLVSGAATAVAHRLKLEFAAAGGIFVTGVTWLALTVTSLDRAGTHAPAHALWLDREAWPLLVAAGMVAALSLISRLPIPARVAALAVAEALVAVLLILPFAQDSGTQTTLAVLVVLLAAGGLTWNTSSPWSLSGALTLSLGSIWMLSVAAELTTVGVERFARAAAAAWSGSPGDRFPALPLGDGPAPWLLPAAMIALVATVIVCAHTSPAIDRMVAPAMDVVLGAALLVAAAVATLILYPVPIWLALAPLLVSACAFAAWAIVRRSAGSLAAAGVFLGGGLILSLHDEWLNAPALTVTVALSGAVHLRWRTRELSALGGALLAISTAGAVWTWGAVGDGERTWVALVAIAVMAGLALGAPFMRSSLWSCGTATYSRSGLEAGAGAATVALAAVGLSFAPDGSAASWAAVYLTVAGGAVTAMALLREDRRNLAWLGGALLAVATWVRLWDVNVRVPEAYTLPSAVVLVLVGLAHLRRNPDSSTMAALSPGLALALVPSLLWVLREPAEIRSVVLGVACLVLLGAGLRVKWTAPVVYAAAVGSFIVLRHAVPVVDAAVPRWVLIAAAGAVLIGTGITWERRLHAARQLAGYVRELR